MAEIYEMDDERELTGEEKRELLHKYEDDILGGLLASAGFAQAEEEIHPVEIVRGDVLFFRFRIHPLREEDYHRCRNKYTVYKRSRQLGTKVPDSTDVVRYRSALIYEATVEEDRKKLWDNKDAWKKLDVITGVDLIDRVLKAGEKDRIVDRIDRISGYAADLEDTAGN